MYKFLTKHGQPLAFGLGMVITVLFLLVVMSNISDFSIMGKEEQVETGIFNLGIMSAIALALIAAASMVLFGLFQVFGDFRGSVKGLLGFGVLLAIFLISYFTASGEANSYIKGAVDKFQETGGMISANNLKFIGAGISTSFILILGAAAAFVLSEIRNFFK